MSVYFTDVTLQGCSLIWGAFPWRRSACPWVVTSWDESVQTCRVGVPREWPRSRPPAGCFLRWPWSILAQHRLFHSPNDERISYLYSKFIYSILKLDIFLKKLQNIPGPTVTQKILVIQLRPQLKSLKEKYINLGSDLRLSIVLRKVGDGEARVWNIEDKGHIERELGSSNTLWRNWWSRYQIATLLDKFYNINSKS